MPHAHKYGRRVALQALLFGLVVVTQTFCTGVDARSSQDHQVVVSSAHTARDVRQQRRHLQANLNPLAVASAVFKPRITMTVPPKFKLSLADLKPGAGPWPSVLPFGLLQADQKPVITSTTPTRPLPSTATASGFALNGGKASAHASSGAKSGSSIQAISDATALANRASVSFAKASADASKVVHSGSGLVQSSATAVADKSSLAVATGGSRSVGLGGHSKAMITSNSAAVDSAISLVGGTAVAISGPNSAAVTSSTSNGAAKHKGLATTRSDSISIGYQGSNAFGSATSNAQATNFGVVSSQSLMESFAIAGTNSTASSVANATAAHAGFSRVQDKAATLGFAGSSVSSETASQGSADVLGLTVIDSVARAITANNQKVCAEAVTKTYSDLPTGAKVSLDTFLLALKQRADQRCVSSFKNLAAAAAAKNAAMGVSDFSNTRQSLQTLPTFARLKDSVVANAQGLIQAAEKATGMLSRLVNASPEEGPVLVSQATWRQGH